MERGVGRLTKIVAFRPVLDENNSGAVAGHTGAKFTGPEGICTISEKLIEDCEKDGQFPHLENASFCSPTPCTQKNPASMDRRQDLSRSPQNLSSTKVEMGVTLNMQATLIK